MFIKGYAIPGVRLDLGFTRNTGGDYSKDWNQYVICAINRIQDNQFIKECVLKWLCCLSDYQVYPSMTLDFYSYSKLSKLILSS